jgi:tripartite-type tricarboxylate transporter receptor subunit TctC
MIVQTLASHSSPRNGVCGTIRTGRAIAIAAALCATPAAAQAQSVADFYRGKTIEMMIGGAVGGGYDLAGRTVAHHIGRHIPGNPGLVVRNMPGATSLIMTNHLYNVAKRDGTVIGMPTSNIPLEQRLKLISADGANVKFEIERFGWIGTPVQEPQITWVWHTAPVQNVDDLRTNVIRMGATTSSADNYLLPTIVNQILATRMQTVTGYIGQNEIFLATERGEVQGNNTGLSNITVNKADWLRDGKVRILLQYGAERLPSLPGVPTAVELAPAETDRALLRFYAVKFSMARPLMAPPDVPAERLAVLRDAFDATMKDPQYLEDAASIGLDVNPLAGEGIVKLIRQVQSTPQPVVDRLRELLAGAKPAR